MGAQQGKSDDERLNIRREKLAHILRQGGKKYVAMQDTEPEIINEIPIETVMSKQNHIFGSSTKRIKVANFARIKREPEEVGEYSGNVVPLEETTSEVGDLINLNGGENIVFHNFGAENKQLNSSKNPQICSIQQANSTVVATDTTFSVETEKNSDLIEFPNSEKQNTIKFKEELLLAHVIEDNSEIDKSSGTVLEIDPINKVINAIHAPIKIESIENNLEAETICNEIEEIVKQSTTQILNVKEELIENETSCNETYKHIVDPSEEQNSELVKNPFSYFKNRRNKNKSRHNHEESAYKNKDDFADNTIKSEPFPINDVHSIEETIDMDSVIMIENQSSTNLNELIIKNEALFTCGSQQDLITNDNLNKNCLSCNLNSSLDVNVDTDCDNLSTKSDKVIKTISLNSSAECLHNLSIIELSSLENEYPPIKSSTKIINKKTRDKPKLPTTKTSKANFRQGKMQKLNKSGRKAKPKTRKSQKDYAVNFPKKKILKNLPKTCINTRRNLKNHKEIHGIKAAVGEKFPKPFRCESPSIMRKEETVASELPKPISFKMESDANVKNKIYFLKPQFQPCVRLHRLKNEELLVPLKIGHVRKIRRFKSASNATNNRHDFLIHNTFSLNQRTKLNRLSLERDHSYYNDQPSVYSMRTNTPNDDLAETDSKYFSPQESYTNFHSSTPDGSSSISGQIDSGVSTSTPSLSQHHQHLITNSTLLLEIAAERAFINNHLMHFGYSPVQFDLFNNLNDLKIFLKYLFGRVNMN